MKRLLEFRRQRKEVIDEMGQIADKAKAEERVFNDEEKARLAQLEADEKRLSADIDELEDEERAQAERLLKIEELRTKGRETEERSPVVRVTREEGTDDKGNCIVWRSLGEQMMAVVQVGKNPFTAKEAARKLDQSNTILRAQASGMSESVMADGGYLVQTDYSTKLLEQSYETGKIASRVQEYPLSTDANAINLPAVDETSRANGSRNGGIRMFWASEAAQYTGTKPKFTFASLKLEKLIGLVYLTDELIQDAGVLEKWVSGKFPEEMGFVLDDAFLNGDGSGKPLGMLKSNALVVQNKESGQANDTINAQNIAKMYARLYEPSLAKAIWIYNQGLKAHLMTLSLTVGSNTIPVFLPGGQSGTFINGIPTSTILGLPAISMEQCEALGDQGDIALIDPSKYLTITKGGLKQASSLHVRFEYDEQVLKFSYRTDGQPEWKAAKTPFKGSDTISPFVTLQAR